MYRYQGPTVDNYICLKEVGTAGCLETNDNNMYRIIGITPEGNIKVIKQTKYNNGSTTDFVWNTKYQNSTCGNKGCPEWPESEIYTTLNTNFYNSLISDIQGKIQKWNWWYGDMHYDYVGTLGVDDLYQVETGVKETKYYEPTKSNKSEVTDQKWTKRSECNIGLIYLHDYYYQANQESCHRVKNNHYASCISQGWMHISKNGGTSSDDEWTMSRIGQTGDSLSGFNAWWVTTAGNGNVANASLGAAAPVRPVFYLKNDIELKGEGSTTNPFYIAN